MDRAKMQFQWLKSTFDTQLSLEFLQNIMLAKVLIIQGVVQPAHPNAHQILNALLYSQIQNVDINASNSFFWFRMDHLLHDITPLEESQSLLFMPARNIRLNHWDDAR